MKAAPQVEKHHTGHGRLVTRLVTWALTPDMAPQRHSTGSRLRGGMPPALAVGRIQV